MKQEKRQRIILSLSEELSYCYILYLYCYHIDGIVFKIVFFRIFLLQVDFYIEVFLRCVFDIQHFSLSRTLLERYVLQGTYLKWI